MHTAATTRTITNVITGVLSPVCTADFLFDCVTAGLGVAMANAQPMVLERADYITKSNDEDGVLHVINKFMLEKN